jgi:hypothetical protein
MKIIRRFLPSQAVCLSLGILAGSSPASLGQTGPTNTFLPIVTVQATDPFASESGDTGTFTLFRDGPTNQTLNVYCVYAGTASNGVDYATLPNFVTIPAGDRTASLTLKPIDDTLVEGTETAELRLAPSPTANPVNYIIGNPSNAVVYIADNDTTSGPPFVRIVTPNDGATFFTPIDIPVCADARAPTGFVATVEFFAGTTSLGIRTNNPVSAGAANPFCITWPNVPPGDYALTAKATDTDGQSAVSPPVNIIVLEGSNSNTPPIVRITSPPNGAVFRAPVDVPIFAFARAPDDAVASVEFLADTNSLGFGTVLPCPTNPPCPLCATLFCPSNYYRLVWTNAPVGPHTLTAQATDSRGAVEVSDPVKITILPLPPPPTNRPPIVNIVATDPIAIEGTNCWPWLGVTNRLATWSDWVSPVAIFRFFTNCGPKNATFTVHRFGATNDPVSVNYAIGGSASNGVDYVTLPDSVTIPAGERSAQITVVPIDDGPPDITSTVVLKLTPDTNYVIGFPSKAAAIILDSGHPHPRTSMLPDFSFHMNASGPDGAWFHIESSADLVNWTPVCTNQVVNGSIDFIDPDAQGNQDHFYRAMPESGPPSE